MRVYLESTDTKLTLDGAATLFTLREQDYSKGLTIDLSASGASVDLSKLAESVASNVQLKFSSPSTSYKYVPDTDKGIVEVKLGDVIVATLPVFSDSKTSVIQFSDKKIALKVTEGLGSLPSTVSEASVVDTTAPVFESATVAGNKLVLHYADANALSTTTALPAAFSVLNGTVANPVTAVSVNGAERTVTLTLTNAITGDQKFTVAYTDPTANDDLNAIQDDSGNDVATFTAQPVTNIITTDTIAPVFASASVTGNTLVMNYTEANSLSSTTADKAAFSVISGGVANPVTAVVVDAALKKITLTLTSAVRPFQGVTVAYTDPTTANDVNALQDAAGNDAISLAPQLVTNTTTDTVAPVIASSTVSGNLLTLTYTDTDVLSDVAPLGSAFAVMVGATPATAVINPVTGVFVSPSAKTVTLALTNPILNGQTVTVAYTDTTVADDINAIQDASGNDAISFTARAVTNSTPADSVAPTFVSGVANGNSLVLSFNDINQLSATTVLIGAAGTSNAFSVSSGGIPNPVTAVKVDAALKTITLTLTTAVKPAEVVTLTYTDPTTTNDVNAIQDVTGNDVATFSASTVAIAPATTATLTNSTAVDAIAPVFASGTVNGNSVVLTYTEAEAFSAVVPATTAFTVKNGGVTNPVTNVVADATTKTVVLVLTNSVSSSEAVTVSYGATAIKDVAGNYAIALTNQALTNNTSDTSLPAYTSMVVKDDTVTITYNETLNKITTPAVPATSTTPAVAEVIPATTNLTTTAFTVKINGVTNTVTSAVADRDAKTVTLKLTTPVAYNQSNVTVAYTAPTTVVSPLSALEDKYGNDAPSFPELVLTNTTVIKTGKTTTAFSGDDFGRGIVLQSDGKILVAGSSDGNFALARYSNVNGSLDTTLDTDGKLTTNFGGNDEGQAVAVQSDGKILVAGYTQKYVGGVQSSDFVLARYSNTDGALDTTFDTDGKVTTDFGGTDLGSSLVVQSDGKILVGGNSNGDFALVRYTTAGALDTTFDTDGKVSTDLGDTDSISGLVVQSTGEIVAVGNSNGDFGLVRYTSAGALDTTFDTDGKVTTDIGTSSADTAYSVALQSDGKILVAGSSAGNFALARYNADGSLDTTFDTDGVVTTDIGTSSTDAAYKVLVQTDGKILVGGSSNNDFALVRYTTAGALDTTFSTDGKLTLDFAVSPATTEDYAYNMALQSDGKIILTGTSASSTGTNGVDVAIARFNTDGSLDTTFGV